MRYVVCCFYSVLIRSYKFTNSHSTVSVWEEKPFSPYYVLSQKMRLFVFQIICIFRIKYIRVLFTKVICTYVCMCNICYLSESILCVWLSCTNKDSRYVCRYLYIYIRYGSEIYANTLWSLLTKTYNFVYYLCIYYYIKQTKQWCQFGWVVINVAKAQQMIWRSKYISSVMPLWLMRMGSGMLRAWYHAKRRNCFYYFMLSSLMLKSHFLVTFCTSVCLCLTRMYLYIT